MNSKLIFFFIALLLTISSTSLGSSPEPSPTQPKPNPTQGNNAPPPENGFPGRFFGPGGVFDIPGLGQGWAGGFGSGYSGPNGGHFSTGLIKPSVECKDKGPCYMKTLTCPANCFQSYGRSGKNYGSGGGGGGCTMDCKKCVAYC